MKEFKKFIKEIEASMEAEEKVLFAQLSTIIIALTLFTIIYGIITLI